MTHQEEMIEYLVEGSVTSAISGYLKGTEPHAQKQIERDSNKKTLTKKQKEELLEKLDDMIDNSNRILTSPRFSHFVADVLLSFSAIAPLFKLVTRAVTTKDRKAYREALYDLRSKVKAIPTKG